MRVHIMGESPCAKVIRGYLARHDFHLTDHRPDWVVYVEERAGVTRPVLDSVHCALDQAILRHLRKQTDSPIEIHTAGGIESDNAVRIVLPPIEAERKAVETGVFRALLELANQHSPDSTSGKSISWWKNLFSRKRLQ